MSCCGDMDSGSIGYDSDTVQPIAAYKLGSLAEYVPAAVDSGNYELRLSADGEGGTYFLTPNGSQPLNPIAVFKPAEEEIGCFKNPHGHTGAVDTREGFALGDCHKREMLAYVLDYDHFSNVPETTIVEIHGRAGSVQRYIPGMKQCWDFLPGIFSREAVQRIAILDIRTLNGDRHGGNILVRPGDSSLLVPIDHSYILPNGYADPDFEWMDWPQAKMPLQSEELNYIARLDPDADEALVSKMLGDEAGEIIALTTRLLKTAAPRGYTLHEMAHFCRRDTLTQPSGLERLIAASRTDLDRGGMIDKVVAQKALEEIFPLKR